MTVRYKYIGMPFQFSPVHNFKKPTHIYKYKVNLHLLDSIVSTT